MAIALPVTGSTVMMEATIGEDGFLHTAGPISPALIPGMRVMLAISPIANDSPPERISLAGTVMRYDDPFGPAAPTDDWETLR
jgi:hypothetical protein